MDSHINKRFHKHLVDHILSGLMNKTHGSGMVHITRMVDECISRPEISGVYNATGSDPVTNAEFMRSLRQPADRPWNPPIPAWAVRLGAAIMRTEPELALTGRRCIPARFLEQGFEFRVTDLDAALRDAV